MFDALVRAEIRRMIMPEEMNIGQAEALLGEDYVISRAMTWQTSKHLCLIAGQRDPSQYWACAIWNECRGEWIEPTLVFRRLRDLVIYYREKTNPEIPIHRPLSTFSRDSRNQI